MMRSMKLVLSLAALAAVAAVDTAAVADKLSSSDNSVVCIFACIDLIIVVKTISRSMFLCLCDLAKIRITQIIPCMCLPSYLTYPSMQFLPPITFFVWDRLKALVSFLTSVYNRVSSHKTLEPRSLIATPSWPLLLRV